MKDPNLFRLYYGLQEPHVVKPIKNDESGVISFPIARSGNIGANIGNLQFGVDLQKSAGRYLYPYQGNYYLGKFKSPVQATHYVSVNVPIGRNLNVSGNVSYSNGNVYPGAHISYMKRFTEGGVTDVEQPEEALPTEITQPVIEQPVQEVNIVDQTPDTASEQEPMMTGNDILSIQKQLSDNGYYDRVADEMSEQEIKDMQTILKRNGFDLGPTGIDGDYGPYTQTAWNQYMQDGKLGKMTERANELFLKDQQEMIAHQSDLQNGIARNTDELIQINGPDEENMNIIEGGSESVISEGMMRDGDSVGYSRIIRQISDPREVEVVNEEGTLRGRTTQPTEVDVIERVFRGEDADRITERNENDFIRQAEIRNGNDRSRKRNQTPAINPPLQEENISDDHGNGITSPRIPNQPNDIPERVNKKRKEDKNFIGKFFSELFSDDKRNDDFYNKTEYANIKIGGVPLVYEGGQYVVGGGVGLDSNDHIVMDKILDNKKMSFNNVGKLSDKQYDYKDNKERTYWCMAGMQWFMHEKGYIPSSSLAEYGITGDAWEALGNMNKSGNSEVIYNVFAGKEFDLPDTGNNSKDVNIQADNVRRYLNGIIDTDEYADAMKELQAGDIVSLYYKGSDKYMIAAKNTGTNVPTYSTHIGVIISEKKRNGGEELYIWHNSAGHVHKDKLSKVLATKNIKPGARKGTICVTGIGRPGKFVVNDYYDCSKFGVTEDVFYDPVWVTGKGSEQQQRHLQKRINIFGSAAYRMYGALTPNAEHFMSVTGDDEQTFNFLTAMVGGVACQESRYGNEATIAKRIGMSFLRDDSQHKRASKMREEDWYTDYDLRQWFPGMYRGRSILSFTRLFGAKSDTLLNIKFTDKNFSDAEIDYMGVSDILNNGNLSRYEVAMILNSPEFSAQVGYLALSKQAKMLDQMIDYAGLPEKFKDKNKFNDFYIAMMSISWNNGIETEATMKTLKKAAYIYSVDGDKGLNLYIRSLYRARDMLRTTHQNLQAINVDCTKAKQNMPMYMLPKVVVKSNGESYGERNDYMDAITRETALYDSKKMINEGTDSDINYDEYGNDYVSEYEKMTNYQNALNGHMSEKIETMKKIFDKFSLDDVFAKDIALEQKYKKEKNYKERKKLEEDLKWSSIQSYYRLASHQ